MKGLGLAGAGLGAAAATAPVFHDLDEATAASGAEWKRSWWIKNRDINDPTVEIDWSQVVRGDRSLFDPHRYTNTDHADGIYTKENYNKLVLKAIQEHHPDWNGDTSRNPYSDMNGAHDPEGYVPKSTRDVALNSAVRQGRASGISFVLTDYKTKAPEEIGMSKWQGTPEENMRMIRSAFRVIGAIDIGCVEIDSNTRKLILAKDSGRDQVFRDVNEPVQTDTERVIPNSYKWMIVWTEAQPTELTLRKPSTLGKCGKQLSYSRMPQQVHMMYNFLHGIGYGAISGYSSALAPSNPFGTLSGMGEHSRSAFLLTSPEYGNTLRGMNRILTDLPLAPTNPIDAGIHKFCDTCKICAEFCPFDALSLEDSSWDHTAYQPGGFKGWRNDIHRCPFCDGCMAACPFNSTKESPIHSVVAWTVANLPFLNAFNANMERTFGYGVKNPDTWWDIPDEPTYGVSTNFISN
jgi:reductive dehalogenase